jgi:adenylyltransferase/sulfurtransferase
MVRQITVEELSARMAAGERLVLLDVRQPWEHETAALPGSVLIPLDELTSRADELEVPEGAAVVAYCHHGVRSLSAAAILERLGHPGVMSLRGGIDAWSLRVDPTISRY